jgi:hypothetical protein
VSVWVQDDNDHIVTDLATVSTKPCWVAGWHFVIGVPIDEVVLCRNTDRGPCYALVPLGENGLLPERCPRCKQGVPGFTISER